MKCLRSHSDQPPTQDHLQIHFILVVQCVLLVLLLVSQLFMLLLQLLFLSWQIWQLITPIAIVRLTYHNFLRNSCTKFLIRNVRVRLRFWVRTRNDFEYTSCQPCQYASQPHSWRNRQRATRSTSSDLDLLQNRCVVLLKRYTPVPRYLSGFDSRLSSCPVEKKSNYVESSTHKNNPFRTNIIRPQRALLLRSGLCGVSIQDWLVGLNGKKEQEQLAFKRILK